MDLKKPYKPNGPNSREDFPDNYRENPFSVPEGYFNDLPGRIMQNKAIAKEKRVRHMAEHSRPWAIAAVIVILAGIFSVIFYQRQDKTETEPTFFTISLSDFEQVYPLESLDEYTLVNYFSTSAEVPDVSFNDVFWNIVQEDSSLDTSDIKQYLLQSNEIENLLLEL
jgi:hypothetical protein